MIFPGEALVIAYPSVSQLPEIIHRDESSVTATGWKWWLRFLFINIAMLITYVIILLLAVYEENLEHLI